MLYIKLKR